MPSDTEILDAIKDALRRHGVISSQKKFADLVLRELHRHDPDYSVSDARIRRLALAHDLVTIDIKTRESDQRTSAGLCPVCSSKTERIRNLTVYGGTVTRGYRCKNCGYWTGLRKRVPTLYVFSPKG
jgi:DNA-directed RNA polymerase subunit RPC12/RpoP